MARTVDLCQIDETCCGCDCDGGPLHAGDDIILTWGLEAPIADVQSVSVSIYPYLKEIPTAVLVATHDGGTGLITANAWQAVDAGYFKVIATITTSTGSYGLPAKFVFVGSL